MYRFVQTGGRCVGLRRLAACCGVLRRTQHSHGAKRRRRIRCEQTTNIAEERMKVMNEQCRLVRMVTVFLAASYVDDKRRRGWTALWVADTTSRLSVFTDHVRRQHGPTVHTDGTRTKHPHQQAVLAKCIARQAGVFTDACPHYTHRLDGPCSGGKTIPVCLAMNTPNTGQVSRPRPRPTW